MKKNIIFFSLFFCTIIAEAQTYIPFPTNNSSWVESRTFRRQGFPTYVNCFQMLTRIDQDTIMSGLQYHRLYQVFIDYTDHTQCISNTYDSIMYYGGYIRNDSLNKKVYFKLSPSSPDTLLYDFDLKLGQLYPSTYLSYANPSLDSDSVIRIDSIYINSRWHKRFTLTKNKNNCNNSSTYYLIEGVGSSSGFWSRGNCDTL